MNESNVALHGQEQAQGRETRGTHGTHETPLNGHILDNDNPLAEIVVDDPKPIHIPIRVGGVIKYFLTEASADAARIYRNVAIRGSTMHDGIVQMGNSIADAEPALLAMCLYYATPDGQLPLNDRGDLDQRKLVPIAVIKSLPSRLTEPLYERAKIVSKLAEGADTVESLDKQIAKLQRRRQKLLAAGKGLPNGSSGSSGSHGGQSESGSEPGSASDPTSEAGAFTSA